MLTRELVPLILLWPILAAVAYSDLRYMKIPNWLVLMALALFVLTLPLFGLPEITARLVLGGIVFLICLTAFSLGYVGGGDAKFLPVLMLFVPPYSLPLFAYVFLLSVGLGLLFTLALQHSDAARRSGWAGTVARGRFPAGVTMALAGLGLPIAQLLLAQ